MTRIPTTLTLSLILVLLILGVMYYFYSQSQKSIQNISYSPKQIIYSNILANSFTISWFSDTPNVGSISWGTSPALGQNSPDDRDQKSPPIPRLTHTVTVHSLTPLTSYYFKIRNGPFFFPNTPLEIKTSPLTPPTPASPIIGKVKTHLLESFTDALVFLQTNTSSQISAYVLPENGNFILPLSDLKTKDLNASLSINQPVSLLISDSVYQSIITLNPSTDLKLPTITLGQNLDLSPLQIASSSTQLKK